MRVRPLAVLLAAVAAVSLSSRVHAKHDAETWKGLQAEAARLFVAPGNPDEKKSLINLLVEDQDARAWKLLADALVQEAKLWVDLKEEARKKNAEVFAILETPYSKRYPKDEENLQKWQKEVNALDIQARNEAQTLDALVTALSSGPEALRKNVIARGKAAPEWEVRAAAGRVAAAHAAEKDSRDFLQRSLEQDKDPRVRTAVLESLRTVEAGWEDFVIGRFADADWGVQLLAVKIAAERKLRRAVPHLIIVLDKARPRVAEEIGTVLKDLTGQNFDAYGDVWAKWWAEHKDEFEAAPDVKTGKPRPPPPDVKYYGLPVKSDRVLFIIDVSGSMKLEAKKAQPPTPSGPSPTTPGDQPLAPPPAEPLPSGPKIDIAKAELRRAIKKLPKTTLFNIIAFSTTVTPWSKTMRTADEATKAEADTWVATLEAVGGTFVDGALRMAFEIAGLGAVDKAYPEVNVDTIILMSDGEPTDNTYPDTKLMEPQTILDHVKEWNSQRRVVVHTIAMDLTDDGRNFLKALAEQNGGLFTVK
jgi:hypothetical protein